MIEAFHEALAFSVGVLAGFLPCCFVCYPGLFAYFSADDQKSSRMRAAMVCVTFSAGVTLVSALIVGGLLSIGLGSLRGILGLDKIQANYNGWATINPFNPVHTPILVAVNYGGWAILTLIGIIYLTGRNFSIPVPRVSMPKSLAGMRGYRGGFFYGVFIGGPGQAHCTVTILIPVVFLSLVALDPFAVILYFGFFTLGRIIPIFIAGLMLQDMRMRFVKSVTEKSTLINRLIGVTFLIGGLVLLFWL
jgi:cytochrome c biogenesis protein CcdA